MHLRILPHQRAARLRGAAVAPSLTLLGVSIIVAVLGAPRRVIAQSVSANSPTATLRARVISGDSEAGGAPTAVADAVVRSGSRGGLSDATGRVTLTLPVGAHVVIASKLGYAPDTVRLTLAVGADTAITFRLRPQAATLSVVTVSAARGGDRRVSEEPTRVEVIGHEDVEEKTAMQPGNIAMLLNETSGVRVAATSPALGGANVRIQGLRGRYTQLLSDGLPLYGLSAEGLGLLQIPPVDLSQVEIIKGAASALYGPTALGGVVNLVSRRPGAEPERELLLNQTSRDATDAVYFDARRLSPAWGYTLLASAHRQRRLDLDDDGWADLAGYERGVLRPRVFWTSPRGHSVFATAGAMVENRAGGTVGEATLPTGIGAGRAPFSQGVRTRRGDVGTVARFLVGNAVLAVRASATSQERDLTFGPADDHERRQTLFGEATYSRQIGAQTGVLGVAFQRDAYRARTAAALDYTFNVPALFAQHTWTPDDRFGLTSSARLDAHSVYGTVVSPRLSALVRPFAKPSGREDGGSASGVASWTARLSAGTGLLAPTPFTEETEELALSRIRRPTGLVAERARSVSADVGGLLGGVELNGSVYASDIRHAAALRRVSAPTGDDVVQVNAVRPTRTGGAEAFARYRREPFVLTATYAYLRVTEEDVETGGRRGVPLTPRHSGGVVAMFEEEDGTRVGIEGYYTGRQPLADNPYRAESRPYVLVGLLAQKRIGEVVVFANLENLLDVRQTRTDPLLLPAQGPGGRWTTDAWAPLEGRVLNLGVRLGARETGEEREREKAREQEQRERRGRQP